MKAMIMAAGFGTRLRPLTDNLPKALVPVLNRPVLERNIEYLGSYGIKDIIINAHYHSDLIQDFTASCKIPGTNLTVSIEKEILGTGGGIARCREFLKDSTFIVINSDILTDTNLDQAAKWHLESGDPVTMIVHDCPSFNQIDITPDSRVKAINKNTAPGRVAFTGIHIISPEIFDFLPENGYADIISEGYNPLLESGRSINAFMAVDHYWYDIGTIESYKKATLDFLNLENKKFIKGDNTHIDPTVALRNWAVIGNNVTIGRDAVIDSSIIWDNAVIEEGVHIKDSIVTQENNIVRASETDNIN